MDLLSTMARMIELGTRCYAMTFEEEMIDVGWSFGESTMVVIETDFNDFDDRTSYVYHPSDDLVEWVAGNFAHKMAEDLAEEYEVDAEALYKALRNWVMRCYATGDIIPGPKFRVEKEMVEVNVLKFEYE